MKPLTSSEAPATNDPLADFKRERLKYKALRKQQGKKGQSREDITLTMLQKFQSKLDDTRETSGGSVPELRLEPVTAAVDGGEEEEDLTDTSWYDEGR